MPAVYCKPVLTLDYKYCCIMHAGNYKALIMYNKLCFFKNKFHMQEYIGVLYNYTVNPIDSTHFAHRVSGLFMF